SSLLARHDAAATRQPAVQPTTMYLRNPVMVLPSRSRASGFPELAAEPAAVVPTKPRALPARPNGRRPARRPLTGGRSNRVNDVHPGASPAGAATAVTRPGGDGPGDRQGAASTRI